MGKRNRQRQRAAGERKQPNDRCSRTRVPTPRRFPDGDWEHRPRAVRSRLGRFTAPKVPRQTDERPSLHAQLKRGARRAA